MTDKITETRKILEVTGADRLRFLQDLVTNDVAKLGAALVYAALLNPQGKFLFDFFLFQEGETVYLDIREADFAGISARLSLYKLRADVTLASSNLRVIRGLGQAPEGAKDDPRHRAMGWRLYTEDAAVSEETIDWDAIRVAHLIPETGVELLGDDSYILEMAFERLNGVNFRKGCYVGQEVTARMKHKTELRKGLARVSISGTAEVGDVITKDGKPVGKLGTISNDQALAYLRFDRADGVLSSGSAILQRID